MCSAANSEMRKRVRKVNHLSVRKTKPASLRQISGARLMEEQMLILMLTLTKYGVKECLFKETFHSRDPVH
jgi:hypothetical protein